MTTNILLCHQPLFVARSAAGTTAWSLRQARVTRSRALSSSIERSTQGLGSVNEWMAVVTIVRLESGMGYQSRARAENFALNPTSPDMTTNVSSFFGSCFARAKDELSRD